MFGSDGRRNRVPLLDEAAAINRMQRRPRIPPRKDRMLNSIGIDFLQTSADHLISRTDDLQCAVFCGLLQILNEGVNKFLYHWVWISARRIVLASGLFSLGFAAVAITGPGAYELAVD
jgi:hypothetical protein